jgi:hypothetical protein
MYVSIKTHIIVILILATMLPFILLRIFAYPIIQSDLKTVIMDNLEAIGQAILMWSIALKLEQVKKILSSIWKHL